MRMKKSLGEEDFKCPKKGTTQRNGNAVSRKTWLHQDAVSGWLKPSPVKMKISMHSVPQVLLFQQCECWGNRQSKHGWEHGKHEATSSAVTHNKIMVLKTAYGADQPNCLFSCMPWKHSCSETRIILCVHITQWRSPEFKNGGGGSNTLSSRSYMLA